MSDAPVTGFSSLNLTEPLLKVLGELGYESPSPIQAQTIPILMTNRDVLGQAQTGTGKTAAFALPILARIDIRQAAPQALVLAPTRELAIQVAEAFQRYATHIPGFHVLPIYGGQSYGPQLNALRRGVHVIVGTPGRVIDHIEKNSLDLSHLKTLVLDEADEMLRMGFIDDVETILQKTPAQRQTALFSATMPSAIRRIAQTYLRNPSEVTIAAKTGTAENIRQRYWLVSGMHKLDALTRILEAETFDGMIIFVRTKLETEELAGKLQARGFSAAAINGDIVQQQRERTIHQLKDGNIDILVATDVAARGLDVERISHVINYDVPYDPESYTHRIGRTGRAGRSGEAILFISPRERNLLKAIERATRQPVSLMELPSIQAVNDVRIARFKDQISNTLAAGNLEVFQSLIEEYEKEHNIPAIEIAAALAKLVRGDEPLLLEKSKSPSKSRISDMDSSLHSQNKSVGAKREGTSSRSGDEGFTRSKQAERPSSSRHERADREPDAGMQTFRIEVGHAHGVKPGNIVGAIANEAGLDAKHIGRIEIYDDYSTLDLPDSMPDELLNQLKTVWVASRQLQISRLDDARKAAPASAKEKERGTAHQPASTAKPAAGNQDDKPARKAKIDMQTFRIEVGHTHGVKPGNIVGAIANEAGLEAKYIGQIEIFDDYSVLDLPSGMPREIFEQLKAVVVSGQMLQISEMGKGTKANHGHASQKIPLSAPLKGGDRRVQEKQAEKKAKPDHSTSAAKRHSKEAPSNSKPPRKNKKLA